MPSPTSAPLPGRLPAAVLWDMDGTVVDTEPLWAVAEAEVAARHGLVWDHARSAELVGMPLTTYGRLLVELGVQASVEAVVDDLVAAVRGGIEAGAQWQPGVRELMTALVAQGVPGALVTMSYLSLARPVAAQAPTGTFRVLVTGERVTHGKPHPEAYLRAAEELGVPIGSCVAIEDSPVGVAAAMAAGARTIGVPHLLPLEPRPGLSLVRSVAQLGLAEIAAVAAGDVLDLRDA